MDGCYKEGKTTRYIEVLKAVYRLSSEVGGIGVGLWEVCREVSAEPYQDVADKVYEHLRFSRARKLVKAKKVPIPGRGAKNLYSLTASGISRVEWFLEREAHQGNPAP